MGHRKSANERAKDVLDLCAHILKDVQLNEQAMIEYAIATQINEAIDAHMVEVNRAIIAHADNILANS